MYKSFWALTEKIAIHETAFVTSAFRASNRTLSKDPYAQLWPTEKTTVHAQHYASSVSDYEPFAHCLRNRFFFEILNNLVTKNKIEILINFGCGFSMYPFLLPKKLVHIEIDKSNVIDYKKGKIQSFQSNGFIPLREVHYIAADFNRDGEAELLSEIKKIKNGRPSFILIEGVLFFISGGDSKRLFSLFDKIQGTNEFIGSVSFRKSLEETEVFKKMIRFIEGNLDKNAQFGYQTVDDDFYQNLEHYSLIDHQDTLKLSETYAPDKSIITDEVLNEHMYVLKKQKK